MDEITSPQNLIQWLPTALRKPKHLSLISAGLLLISFLVVFISLGGTGWAYATNGKDLLDVLHIHFGLCRVCYDGTMYKSWCDNYAPSFTSKVIAGGGITYVFCSLSMWCLGIAFACVLLNSAGEWGIPIPQVDQKFITRTKLVPLLCMIAFFCNLIGLIFFAIFFFTTDEYGIFTKTMSGLRPAWSWITILIVDFLGIFPAAYLLNQEASIRAMKPESRTLIDMPLPLAQGEKIITPSGIVSGLLAASIYFLFIFMSLPTWGRITIASPSCDNTCDSYYFANIGLSVSSEMCFYSMGKTFCIPQVPVLQIQFAGILCGCCIFVSLCLLSTVICINMMKGKEIINHLPNNFTKPDIPAKLTLASFILILFGLLLYSILFLNFCDWGKSLRTQGLSYSWLICLLVEFMILPAAVIQWTRQAKF